MCPVVDGPSRSRITPNGQRQSSRPPFRNHMGSARACGRLHARPGSRLSSCVLTLEKNACKMHLGKVHEYQLKYVSDSNLIDGSHQIPGTVAKLIPGRGGLCWQKARRTPQDRTRGGAIARPARRRADPRTPAVIDLARQVDPTNRTSQLTPFTGLDSSSGMSGPALSLNAHSAVNDRATRPHRARQHDRAPRGLPIDQVEKRQQALVVLGTLIDMCHRAAPDE